MTEAEKFPGAAPSHTEYWKAINWLKVENAVKRLQMRIAKAEREGKRGKAKALQWILSHAFFAKLLAVKRVSQNKGARCPGVDGIIWQTPGKKMQGALSLKRQGYRAQPLRRILIPKKNGKKRPLGIPTMKDRSMQALYLLTLSPIAETRADINSYGFRYYRGCRDAISQCFRVLAKANSSRNILDADIKACFDWIDHDWLLNNIPVDKRMLREWLKSGYLENRTLYPTNRGTPQGGIISPTLANMCLDGLEKVIQDSCPRRSKVNFIRYADDFIVTAASRAYLEKSILPAIRRFLKPRGLELSKEKTRIVRVEEGVEFLGQRMQKFQNKLLTSPSKESKQSFLKKVRETIRACHGQKAHEMIKRLNPIIRGWANYHRYVQSAETFSEAGTRIFQTLKRWIKRRHPKKNWEWIKKTYFRHPKRPWVFCSTVKDKNGKKTLYQLMRPSDIKCVRYIKIKGSFNPFDPAYREYLKLRGKCSFYPITNNLAAGFW